MKLTWIVLEWTPYRATDAANVPGGILVRTIIQTPSQGDSVALVFVPHARVNADGELVP